jgi:hypothetical protein
VRRESPCDGGRNLSRSPPSSILHLQGFRRFSVALRASSVPSVFKNPLPIYTSVTDHALIIFRNRPVGFIIA